MIFFCKKYIFKYINKYMFGVSRAVRQSEKTRGLYENLQNPRLFD